MTSPEDIMNLAAEAAMRDEGVSKEEFDHDLAKLQDYLDQLTDNGVGALGKGVTQYGLFAGYIAILAKFPSHELMAFVAGSLVMQAQSRHLVEQLSALISDAGLDEEGE